MFKADRNLYLDADKKNVLEEGDPKIAWQLVAKGGTLMDSVAAHYGLTSQPAASAPSGEVTCPHCNRTFDVAQAQAAKKDEGAGAAKDNVDHSQEGKMGSTAAPASALQPGSEPALQPGSEVNTPPATNAPPTQPATQGTVSPSRQAGEPVDKAGEPVKP